LLPALVELGLVGLGRDSPAVGLGGDEFDRVRIMGQLLAQLLKFVLLPTLGPGHIKVDAFGKKNNHTS
jgi:hypothetical protein